MTLYNLGLKSRLENVEVFSYIKNSSREGENSMPPQIVLFRNLGNSFLFVWVADGEINSIRLMEAAFVLSNVLKMICKPGLVHSSICFISSPFMSLSDAHVS